MGGDCDTYRRYTSNPGGENKEKYLWLQPMLKSTRYLTPEQKLEIIKYFQNERAKKTN